MSSIVYETSNDLPEGTRAQIADLLNERLADAVDLASQAKQAHWNVKGPQFIALHKLFDDVHVGVTEYADLLAERVVQVGAIAEGTVRMVAGRTELTEYPRTIADGADHASAFAGALAEFGSRMRKAIEQTDELGDKDSADICTEISRGIDKWLWFVEAHVQAPVQRGVRR